MNTVVTSLMTSVWRFADKAAVIYAAFLLIYATLIGLIAGLTYWIGYWSLLFAPIFIPLMTVLSIAQLSLIARLWRKEIHGTDV